MPRKALIIGGGIGGITAAIALARAGFDVAVHEQAPELREVGAGLTVWPNAMKALALLGLADPVWALGRSFGVGRIYDSRGRVLVQGARREDLERRFGWPGLVLHRHRLLDVLAERLPRSVLRLGSRCTGFDQDADGVTAHFADGAQARGDVLIGADGLHSAIRAQVLGHDPPRYAGYVACRGIAPFELGGDSAYEAWGCGQRFGFVPAVGNEIYWWAAVSVSEHRASPQQASGQERYKEELLDRYRGWFAPIERVIAETPDGTILRNAVHDRPPARRWSVGRVTLLGDAAHPVTPDLGQGACLAIEDAAVLARCLADGPDVQAALQRYEARRLGRAAFLARHSRWMGELGQLRQPLLCRLRNALVQWTPAWAALLWLSWQFAFEP
jgi:2-polyprenyl-6-methoxyphenol hydroxylase-like FAD-dependent oxidoreductase